MNLKDTENDFLIFPQILKNGLQLNQDRVSLSIFGKHKKNVNTVPLLLFASCLAKKDATSPFFMEGFDLKF